MNNRTVLLIVFVIAFTLIALCVAKSAQIDEGFGRRSVFDDAVFGFTINESAADPYSAVTYTDDCSGYTPAKMGTDTFNYGSWESFVKDICQPVVIRKNLNSQNAGLPYFVAEKLNPDDYSKTIDGSPSSISNPNGYGYGYEVMVDFKRLYIKVSKEGNIISVKLSKKKIDSSYHAYAFLDGNGVEHEHLYIGVYEGTNYNHIRSINLKPPSYSVQSGSCGWLVDTQTKKMGRGWGVENIYTKNFLALLHVLISKNLDCQAAFGNGVANNSSKIAAGTMNDKGLFYGDTSGATTGVKTFGVENLWGNVHKWIEGIAFADYKCYIISPGVSMHSFKVNEEDYTAAVSLPTSDYYNGYVSEMNVVYDCLIPSYASGSAIYTDRMYVDMTQIASVTPPKQNGWAYGQNNSGTQCGIWATFCNASNGGDPNSAGVRLTYLAGDR